MLKNKNTLDNKCSYPKYFGKLESKFCDIDFLTSEKNQFVLGDIKTAGAPLTYSQKIIYYNLGYKLKCIVIIIRDYDTHCALTCLDFSGGGYIPVRKIYKCAHSDIEKIVEMYKCKYQDYHKSIFTPKNFLDSLFDIKENDIYLHV